MSDDDRNEDADLEKLDGKKLTMSLILKLGSGTLVLGIIGYAASWMFTTLNDLQDGQAKNTETLEMIKKDVDKERQDKAQWARIAANYERVTDNEVQIRVLKEMLKFYSSQLGKKITKKVEEHQPFGPVRPHKLDSLFDEFIKNKNKKPINQDTFKQQSIQQIQDRGPAGK